MIKVEHTRTYTPSYGDRQYRNAPNSVLVTDAELVLVNTQKARMCKLIWKDEDVEIMLQPNDDAFIYEDGHPTIQPIKPILISRTEKIEKGDKYLHLPTGDIYTSQFGGEESNIHKKILALPEHFSKEHLQMYVDGRLKEGMVLVGCEQITMTSRGELKSQVLIPNSEYIQIKFNPHITIYPVEEKMLYTREDILDFIAAYTVCSSDYTVEETKHEFPHQFKSRREHASKWFEQNVK